MRYPVRPEPINSGPTLVGGLVTSRSGTAGETGARSPSRRRSEGPTMKAATWQGPRDIRVEEVPDAAIVDADRRDHPGHHHRSVRLRPAPLRPAGAVHDPRRHRRPRADGRSSRRSAPRCGTWPSATGSWCRSTSAAARAGCARASSTASARPPRTASHGTGASLLRLQQALRLGARLARPSCCGCRSPTSCRSRCPRARPTTGSSSSPTCSRPPGRACSTPTCPDEGVLLVLGAGPIGDMAARIALHRGPPGDRGRPGARAAGAGAAPRAPRPSTSTRSTTWPPRSATAPAAEAPTPSSTRSAWRPTATRSPSGRSGCSGCCPNAIQEPLMMKAGFDRLAAAALRDRRRTPRRHRLAARRVRRRGRPDAADEDVRQADPAADGPGQRAGLDRRHHAAAARRRRPARHRGVRDPPAPARPRRRRPTRSSATRTTA